MLHRYLLPLKTINRVARRGLSLFLDPSPQLGANMNGGGFSVYDINTYDVSETVLTVTSGGTVDLDYSLANVFQTTVTANTTYTFSNPPTSGRRGGFSFYITNGGAFTTTWPATVNWPNRIKPSLSATGRDVIEFTTVDGGAIYDGFAAGQDMGVPT